jgi:hypothetical protein
MILLPEPSPKFDFERLFGKEFKSDRMENVMAKPKLTSLVGRKKATINDKHFQELSAYCEMTDAPIYELIDEALELYIEASLSVDIEQIAEKTASA